MPHHSPGTSTLSERQEVFCQHVARGASGAAAARAAGYAPGNAAQQGSSLLQQGPIRVRIEELRTRREGNRRVSIAEVTDMLRLLMRRAMKAGDHRAAIRCIEVEARLMGLYPDRQPQAFADPLLDAPARPFDLCDEDEPDQGDEEPTPTNPDESPVFPMESSPSEASPASQGRADGNPAPISNPAPPTEATAAVRTGTGAASARPEQPDDRGSGPASLFTRSAPYERVWPLSQPRKDLMSLRIDPRKFPDPKEDLRREGGSARLVLGGGCFWCTEAVYRLLDGVTSVRPGYAGGSADTADYESVCTGTTGHAEVIEVQYDPARISYGQILKVFFSVTHDPTQINRQGADIGTQYRSVIFYDDEDERRVAEAYIRQLNEAGVYDTPIATTLEPLDAFYPAEKYHHGYAERNPGQPYIRMVSDPKVKKLKETFADKLKA